MQILADMFWHGTGMAQRSVSLLIKAAPECVAALVGNSCAATIQGEAMYIVNQLCSWIFCTMRVSFKRTHHYILRDYEHMYR